MGIPYNETWEDLDVYVELLEYNSTIEDLTFVDLDIDNENQVITLDEE